MKFRQRAAPGLPLSAHAFDGLHTLVAVRADSTLVRRAVLRFVPL